MEQIKRDFHDFQLTVEEILFGMDTRLNEMSKEISALNINAEKSKINFEKVSSELKQVSDAMDNGFELAFRKISEK